MANPEGYHVHPEVDEALEQVGDIYIDAVDGYMDAMGVPKA